MKCGVKRAGTKRRWEKKKKTFVLGLNGYATVRSNNKNLKLSCWIDIRVINGAKNYAEMKDYTETTEKDCKVTSLLTNEKLLERR